MLTCATTVVRDVLGALWRIEVPQTPPIACLCHDCGDDLGKTEYAVCGRCVIERAVRKNAEFSTEYRKILERCVAPLTPSVLARKPETVARVKRKVARMRRKR